MIGFLQPLALVGLVAAAVPPLLHLLGRRRPPTVVFPAIRYLTATEREHSRRLKLRNLLLMLLRIAIIALIVLAASRPVTRVVGGEAHPPSAMAVVVDNSLSSGAVVGGQRVLDLLRARARTVFGRLSTGDRAWLVLADGVPQRIGRDDAIQLLDSLAPWAVRLDVAEAVRTAARVVEDARLPVREVVVLSDLQATALSPGPPPSVPVLFAESPRPPDNVSVDSALAVPPVWSPVGAVVVTLGGGEHDQAPRALRLVMNGGDLARAVASPGDRVVLEATVAERGWAVASVVLDPDELRADDRRWLAVHVSDAAPVRLSRGAGPFAEKAFRVLLEGGRLRDGSNVTIADRVEGGNLVLLPPADPALLGATNRALEARGVSWRFGDVLDGEWQLDGDVGPITGTAVYRRYTLRGSGSVLARADGEPWLVRDGGVLIVASRLEDTWTALPVTAAFLPFLDVLLNRVAAAESWIAEATPGARVRLPASAAHVLLPEGAAAVSSDRYITAPIEPGVYFLRGAGDDTVGALQVNPDPRESRLASASASTVAATFGSTARLLGSSAFDRELFGGAQRAELTGVLLIAALVAALAELALATFGGALRPG